MDCVETLESLRLGKDCITPVDLFDVSGCRCSTAGRIPEAEANGAVALHARSRRWHRSARMLLLALDEALRQRPGFTPESAVVATTSGGMSWGEMFYRGVRAGVPAARFRNAVRAYVPQQPVLDAFCARGIHVYPVIVSNACASGSNAILHAWRTIRAGRAERVVVAGYDALSQLVFAGFDSLRASTPEKCRPFDRDRSGLVLGEGAAVLLLESGESAAAAGVNPLAEVAGCGCANDNHHLTQPHPSGMGPRLSMERALAAAGVGGEAVDYVNAHGTGTPFNDSSEGAAIQAVCPNAPVSSSKAMIGHTLGAAGVIEALFCILAMRNGFLPGNPNLREPDPALRVNLVHGVSTPAHPRRVLSNSFGFGGANASVLLAAA